MPTQLTCGLCVCARNALARAGLAPLSTVSRPSYATEDPLRQRYPATSANPHDPLNWITEDLFAIR